MTARDELAHDIELTDRLLQYSGYSDGLRQRLLEARAAMMRELAGLDMSLETKKKPPGRAKIIEFPGKPKTPRKAK